MSSSFKIEARIPGSLGRAGVIKTPHGEIHTPAFTVVGTKATVKALTPEMISSLGAEAVLANTYHLYLEPGEKIVKAGGGLGKFMNWSGPTLTDSGGFQVFSLGEAFGKSVSKIAKEDSADKSEFSLLHPVGTGTPARTHQNAIDAGGLHEQNFESVALGAPAKIDDDGVTFRSPRDGSEHRFTPEKSMQIQHDLGADIIFAFDECTASTATYEYQKEALARTHAWAKRSLDEHKKLGGTQALFGIVQGGRHQDLREESARTIGAMDFDGFGIGGSFIKKDIDMAVGWVNQILPEDKPRHLLGIGAVEDIFAAVEMGVDTFDCVAPTREARNGALWTKAGRINILNQEFREDFSPIEKGCQCYTCQNFTRSYIAHLFRAKEILANTLASVHNLYFIVNLVKNIRQSILDNRFTEFKKSWLN